MGDATPLLLHLHVADLTTRGTLRALEHLPIDAPLFVEVGASDRNTADVELLSKIPNGFLITTEPLVDKYARALARRVPAARALDRFEPLGKHHERGLILPIAVGPEAPQGALRQFNVGATAGCSSMLSVKTDPAFGAWCSSVREVRTVPVFPLVTILKWIGRTVDFIKVDAQGLDLQVIESGAARLSQVKSFALEVISDDCPALYAGQPNCSTVKANAERLGFMPAGPLPCRPRFGRPRTNHFCELEVLFVRAGSSQMVRSRRYLFEYHNLHLNGCGSLYRSKADAERSSPSGVWAVQATAVGGGMTLGMGARFRFSKSRGSTTRAFTRAYNHSNGLLYGCPESCFGTVHERLLPRGRANSVDEPRTTRPKVSCPWVADAESRVRQLR